MYHCNDCFPGQSGGRNAFGCSISSPDISQLNCCQVSRLTSMLLRGQRKRLELRSVCKGKRIRHLPIVMLLPGRISFHRRDTGLSYADPCGADLQRCTQPIDRFSHVCVAGYDIEFIAAVISPNMAAPSAQTADGRAAEDPFHSESAD